MRVKKIKEFKILSICCLLLMTSCMKPCAGSREEIRACENDRMLEEIYFNQEMMMYKMNTNF